MVMNVSENQLPHFSHVSHAPQKFMWQPCWYCHWEIKTQVQWGVVLQCKGAQISVKIHMRFDRRGIQVVISHSKHFLHTFQNIHYK